MFSGRWTTRQPAALAAALAALALATPAGAAPPWTEPQAIPGGATPFSIGVPGSGLAFRTALVGFTPGGNGVAVLGNAAGGQGISRFSAAQGTFAPVQGSSMGGVAAEHIALYGRDGIVVAGQANRRSDPRSRLSAAVLLDAAVARGTLSGSIGRRQVLGEGLFLGSAAPAIVTAVAANPAGDAAVVVSIPERGRVRVAGYRSWVFIRRRTQTSFKRKFVIGRRTVGHSQAALAVNGPGDVLVALDDRTDVLARVTTASGRVRDEQRIGQGGSAYIGANRISASMDASRRMLVAWIAQRVGSENNAGGPGIVAFAYASPSDTFGRAQVLQRGLPTGFNTAIAPPGIQAMLLRSRGALVWTGAAGRRHVVRSTDVVSGRATAAVELSPAGQLRGMAAGPRGGLIASWLSTAPSARGLFAATRGAGTTTWAGAESILALSAGTELRNDAPLAVDPVSGVAVQLWSEALPSNTGPTPVRYSVRRP